MKKGTCQNCSQFRSLLSSHLCQSCSRPISACVQCHQIRKLYFGSVCSTCHEDQHVREKLLQSEPEWTPSREYPQHLFHLYLSYIRRNKLRYPHLAQARKLSLSLIHNPPDTILSWKQISALSKRDGIQHQQSGCAWRKIGRMLYELGVLPLPVEEKNSQLENIIESFDNSNRYIISLYVNDFIRTVRRLKYRSKQIHSNPVEYKVSQPDHSAA